MPYDNIPGVGATILDGAFNIQSASSQLKILCLGTATSGLSNEIFNVNNVRTGENEFGSATEIFKLAHEAIAQGADNIAVMRIGGRTGSVVISDASASLTIVPEMRDAQALDRYRLVIVANTVDSYNRILIYDDEEEAFVFDTDSILALDEGQLTLTDTGLSLQNVGSITSPETAPKLSSLVTGDFTAQAGVSVTTVVATAGQDGTSMSLVERYAALNTAFHMLDFKDCDLVVPASVYIDDKNVVDGDTPALWAGLPLDGETDALGYVWQYIYQGKLYTYFTDAADYFTTLGTAVAASVATVTNTSLSLVSKRTGAGANGKFSLEVVDTGAVAPGEPAAGDITIQEVAGVLTVVADTDATSTTGGTAAAINEALAAFQMSNGLTADTVLLAAGDGTVIVPEAAIASTGGVGGNAATHADLTGDAVPVAVQARWAAGADGELREVNFAHQLASFCELASVSWKSIMGAISFKAPPAFSRSAIASWMGSLPTYTQIGLDLAIDSVADNGSGVLGNRFMAGAHGYRAAMVEEGSNDGYAYGGLIKTKGSGLPNGSDWSYGIADGDEATDIGGKPVDLGKHIWVSYDWPIHRNAYNGGSSYRGSMPAQILGKLVTLSEKEEPIGTNGKLARITSPPRVHSTQVDEAALIRLVGLRQDNGYIIVSAKTAAHPDSDYIRSSTMRSINRALNGIRRICAPYIGKEFSTQKIVALQTAIDSFLREERNLGFNNGARAGLRFSRTDRIMGKLTVVLRVVPPFSIDSITVETSLAAEESEL